MATIVDVPCADSLLASVSIDRLFVTTLAQPSSPENAARFRYLVSAGDRDHFPVTGIGLAEFRHDGKRVALYEDILAMRVCGGKVGVFWHAPPKSGLLRKRVGAHAWDLKTKREVLSFAEGAVTVSDPWVLGRVEQEGETVTYSLLDARTGAKRASVTGQDIVAMSTDDERAYFLDARGGASAHRVKDGKRAWRAKLKSPPSTANARLALGDGCVWFATDSGVVGLDAATGKVAAEHELRGDVLDVVETASGAFAVRANEIDRLTTKRAVRAQNIFMGDRRFTTNGRWAVAVTRGPGNGPSEDLLVIDPRGSFSYWRLASRAFTIRVGDAHLAIQLSRTKFAVVSLNELSSSKRVIKDDSGAVLAKSEKLEKGAPSAGALRLAEALRSAKLLPAQTKTARDEQLLSLFGLDKPSLAGAAMLLEAAGAGPKQGFVAHDRRFGQETDDVIAEFDAAIGPGKVRAKQVRNDAKGLVMRVTHPEGADEFRFPTDVALPSVAGKLDAVLAKARAPKRIYSLETNGDGYAFVAVPPKVAATLRKAKVSVGPLTG